MIPTSKEGLVVSLNNNNVLLCDYDIDGDDFKSAHQKWLHENVIEPFGTSKSSSMLGVMGLIIEGRASRSGSEGHNLALSQRRAAKVQAYLKNKVSPLVVLRSYSKGESLSSYGDNTEYSIDRAVRIQLGSAVRITPKIVRRPVTKMFKLRVISADALSGTIGPGKVGMGITFEELYIQIWDVSKSTIAMYVYTNSGKSGGVGLGLPISPEKALPGNGVWNEFSAPSSMTADGFGGHARLEGGVGLNFGISLLSTDRNFHFGGFKESKWWSAPAFKFQIKGLEMNRGSSPSAGISFYEAGPVGKLKYIKGSLRNNYTGNY